MPGGSGKEKPGGSGKKNAGLKNPASQNIGRLHVLGDNETAILREGED